MGMFDVHEVPAVVVNVTPIPSQPSLCVLRPSTWLCNAMTPPIFQEITLPASPAQVYAAYMDLSVADQGGLITA